MFRRTIASALITAAAVAAALAYKALLESKEEPEKEENDDDEIRFIRISDDDEPKAKEPEMPKEVQEICAVYPYLNADFVKEELAKSAGLNAEYTDRQPKPKKTKREKRYRSHEIRSKASCSASTA